MVALVPLGRNSLTGNTTMPMLYILQQLRSVHTPGATRFEKCGLRGDVILTVLAQAAAGDAGAITTPDALRLKIEPVADCGRYDSIRKVA